MRIKIVHSSDSQHPPLHLDLEVVKKLMICGFNPRNYASLTLEAQRFLIETWSSLELAHLCRMFILKEIAKYSDIQRESVNEKIDKLPFPKLIKSYMRFFPNEED